MNQSQKTKSSENSQGYGEDYQIQQADRYRDRKNNHWKYRIELAKDLVQTYVKPQIETKPKNSITVVDVGCSIGTFAIEFSKLGYNCFGIDFDQAALDIANELSKNENVTPKFVCGDVSEWRNDFPPIDIAICFDIFEHLHDDELGSFLTSIRRQFSENGFLVFHTYPTEFDYIFYRRSFINFPLRLFAFLPTGMFCRVTKLYACILDALLILFTGKNYKARIKYSRHCNPTTEEKLKDILKRAGYHIQFIQTSNLYDKKVTIPKQFHKHSITHRNLYGVAIPE